MFIVLCSVSFFLQRRSVAWLYDPDPALLVFWLSTARSARTSICQYSSLLTQIIQFYKLGENLSYRSKV